MKPELKFEEVMMSVSDLGEEASVPDLIGSLILQNDLEFHLEEEEEIYEGYGRRSNAYPYRHYHSYDRTLKQKPVKTAVLENDFIRGVFLPELGGRLWELWDKQTGKNLLYTNDVIRYSNLAIRNAWFSGGVEWNMGMIGHTPFTTEPLYTAVLRDEHNTPVLRMYEYERQRRVEYQMDFWLGETDTFLNCRMRIVNTSSETVPMYWWSNMAVPEYEGGRVVVPAKEAFTSQNGHVYKVGIPQVEQVDISSYKQIPDQVDYFFDIPENSPKFIANLDETGYGLLHISTKRLKSRKLFSWGNNAGSDRWQEFLTKDAGRYLEIQAGLGKTQYGCIPMAAHTAWEWMEQYGPVQVKPAEKEGSYEQLRRQMEKLAVQAVEQRRLEEVLKEGKTMALTRGTLVYCGSGYGRLEQLMRKYSKERGLSEHLEYPEEKKLLSWEHYLHTLEFPKKSGEERPDGYLCGNTFRELLKETIGTVNKENWYAHYHLALVELDRGLWESAEAEFLEGLRLLENPWCYHGLAALYLLTKQDSLAVEQMEKGIRLRTEDLGYVKDGFKLLMAAKGYPTLIRLYQILPEELRQESRILFDYMVSLTKTGDLDTANMLLQRGFVLDDLREGEDSISDLWLQLHPEATEDAVPREWRFHSL